MKNNHFSGNSISVYWPIKEGQIQAKNRKEQIAIASKIQENCENICKRRRFRKKRRYTCYP
jgi:hypothetical protein